MESFFTIIGVFVFIGAVLYGVKVYTDKRKSGRPIGSGSGNTGTQSEK